MSQNSNIELAATIFSVVKKPRSGSIPSPFRLRSTRTSRLHLRLLTSVQGHGKRRHDRVADVAVAAPQSLIQLPLKQALLLEGDGLLEMFTSASFGLASMSRSLDFIFIF